MIFHTEEGNGFPVVLIHGFCETNQVWKRITPVLATHYRVISIDLPGFGKSKSIDRPFTVEDVAREVLRFLKEELALSSCAVFGHSLGGYVMLAMVEQDETFFSGIGLVHSTALADSAERKQARGKVIEFVKANGVDPFIRSFIPPLFYSPTHPTVAETVAQAGETPQETLIGYTEAMRIRPDRTHVLKAFSRPVFFLAGEKDSIIPVQALEEQARLAPKSSLVIMHGAAHMGMLENAEDTADAMLMFMQKVYGQPSMP